MNLFDQYVTFKQNHPFQVLEVDTQEIQYAMIGEGKHIILTLIGGSMFPTEAYFLMLEKLSKSHQILILNYPKDIHTLKELADIYKQTLLKLNIEQVYLFGANHGGGVAQVFAKLNKESVKGLILYNTIAQSFHMNHEVKELTMQLKQAINELKELRKMVSLDTIKHTLLEQIKTSIPDTKNHMFYEHFISLYQEKEENEHMDLIKDFLENYTFTQNDFKYLQSKTLIFYGHDIDPLGGTEFIEVLADLHQNPHLVYIETDRFQLMSQPKMMVDEIILFINQFK